MRLAYAKVGNGHPIVKVADCFNHLDFEWDSPIWRHWVREFGSSFSLVRYDGRGSGLSDWEVEDVSFEAWIHDLEKVVDAAGLEKFSLMGHSQGGAVAIAYAVRHPERVSHLVLWGGYARGAYHRDIPDAVEVRRALETLVQLNWGRTNPSFFQMVTDLYIPEKATPEEQSWFRSPAGFDFARQPRAGTCEPATTSTCARSCRLSACRTIVFHSDRDTNCASTGRQNSSGRHSRRSLRPSRQRESRAARR